MTIKFDAIEQFGPRPTLRSVAIKMLSAGLIEQYPNLVIDPARFCIAPVQPGTNPTLSQPYASLVDQVLIHFLRQSTPYWAAADYRLMPMGSNPSASLALAVDMSEISALVDRCALGLMDSFKQAVADFWSQPGTLGDKGTTRLAWLAQRICQNLLAELACDDSGALDAEQKAALSDIAKLHMHPGIHPGIVYVTLTEGAVSEHFPLPMLVVIERGSDQPAILVYRLWGRFERYSPAEWEARLRQDFIHGQAVERLQWGLNEPQGDVFEGLAQAVLEHQLSTLEAFRRDAGSVIGADVGALERYFEAVTDLNVLFMPHAERLANPQRWGARLPDWLRNASEPDRIVYSRSMIALAAVQDRSKGNAFDDDLPPIREFTGTALLAKMLEVHPDARDLSLAQIELVIDKVTAVAAGSGGQVSALGEVEKVRMGWWILRWKTLLDCQQARSPCRAPVTRCYLTG